MRRYPSLKDVLAQRSARRGAGQRRGMNKLEARYAEKLQGRKNGGEISEWKFEALKLRIGTNCWYTPDFLAKYADGAVELIECKAMWKVNGKERPGYRDDARVKVRAAVELYGGLFRFVGVYERRDGSWQEEAF